MGGVQSSTHNLGDALWVQERQKQKGNRDNNKYESKYECGNGSVSQNSTQERRKLLKRTRSLAVITEDESNRAANVLPGCVDVLGPRLGVSYDTSSLQHHRRLHHHHQQQQHQHQQLIPRAKLIDRNSLKDRLSKSQQHLSDCYYGDRNLSASSTDLRFYQSRSVCGLYNTLPPPLDSLPDPLPYTRAGGGGRAGLYQGIGSSATLQPDRINILKWPEHSARRYRSVQDLNTVSGLVDIVEDNYCGWPAAAGFDEENRSLDCIYTQVKRKRKEHRSLDSILFEDDSDELEYFDVLNLLPLSNVRLEIDDESDDANRRERNFRGGRPIVNRDLKSNPAIVSVATKCSRQQQQHHSGPRITEIRDTEEEKSVTSFREIAREKQCSENYDNNNKILDSVQQKKNNNNQNNQGKNSLIGGKRDRSRVEETEDTKSLWISDNEETEDMSRRPLVLRVVDSDMTKEVKGLQKTMNSDVKSWDDATQQKENIRENGTVIYRNSKESLDNDKPDLITDHAREPKKKDGNDRLSVENVKNLFEKKKINNSENKISDANSKSGKGSLGFEARSESSDLGLGSEVGSDVRRLSVDDNTNVDQKRTSEERSNQNNNNNKNNRQYNDEENQKNYTNLTRSRSCIDSIECQGSDPDGPEFDHVRYKILKSHMFSKKIFNGAKKDVTYDGLMEYLREYSFQDLLMDNNVVIIEPVRAEVDRKPSFNCDSKLKSLEHKDSGKSGNEVVVVTATDACSGSSSDEKERNHFKKTPRQSSLRKHFFYQPIRVNRELNDEELPDPDTVKNVRMMFEETMRKKQQQQQLQQAESEISGRDCGTRKSVSMRDLRTIDTEKPTEKVSRSRCSSRAKDLTRMFENLDKSSSTTPTSSVNGQHKDGPDCPRTTESKARAIAQSFEARSSQSSPSNSNSSKIRANRMYQHQHQQRQLHNWDAGSVSSGVSSDYPDTDPGSAPACTSSEDEELFYPEDDEEERYESHYVPPDVLKKIREYGTSVTYYGGKVVNSCNGPLICPAAYELRSTKKSSNKALDYIKFRLVKSNSCDSRLELTGRLIDGDNNKGKRGVTNKFVDLGQFTTIDETPSIEITTIEREDEVEEKEKNKSRKDNGSETKEEKREPPVVIGLEPKNFKADFRLGKLDDCTTADRFGPSALSRWQINENAWKRNSDFGKMEFEEFEVLEDSLNEAEH